MLTAAGAEQQSSDYRARTSDFLLMDRFHPHQPHDPYIDPEHPEATNPVNCFEQPCAFEEEWRKYWGGDIEGILEKPDYLQRWDEETPAFKSIRILAHLRQGSPAIAQGEYRTLYADLDILVFERRYQQNVVIVAVNRSDDQTITLQPGIDVTPGSYTGLLTQASEVNRANLH